LLTETEREQFSKNGYLIIEDALTPKNLDICLAAVDRIDVQIRKRIELRVKQTNQRSRLHWQGDWPSAID